MDRARSVPPITAHPYAQRPRWVSISARTEGSSGRRVHSRSPYGAMSLIFDASNVGRSRPIAHAPTFE